MLHAARSQIRDDLIVAMLVHLDDQAGLQSGMIDKAEPAETRIVRPSQRDAGADPAELEWAVIPYQMGIGRDDLASKVMVCPGFVRVRRRSRLDRRKDLGEQQLDRAAGL